MAEKLDEEHTRDLLQINLNAHFEGDVAGGVFNGGPVLTLTAMVDHRYADGSHAARMADAVRRYCPDPGAFEPS
ncbi:hypothetical protein [Actinokineospora sp. HUAS TT18]|uniref:hypothetical protein n=1 Tax=Actinokineospora sp. HUAS TT18 TaxID=3447451 RepID=UPI003F51C5E2